MTSRMLLIGLCVVAGLRTVSAQPGRNSNPNPEATSLDQTSTTTGATSDGFKDDWKRPNGPLGNGWHSAHDDHPNWWDPLELRNAAPVNTNPDKGAIGQPDNAAGRTAAYQDFGPDYADNFTIGTWWNGKHHAHGFPIACINLENPDWGLAFCYEPQIAGGIYVLWAMGRQPHQIKVVKGKGAKGVKHMDGTPVFLEMRVNGGAVTCLAGKHTARRDGDGR